MINNYFHFFYGNILFYFVKGKCIFRLDVVFFFFFGK